MIEKSINFIVLPLGIHIVGRNIFIWRDDCQIVLPSLTNEHSIKWVFMDWCKVAMPQSSTFTERKIENIQPLTCRCNELAERLVIKLKFSKPKFDFNFPHRYGTEKKQCVRVFD